jgi:acyl-CoA synthetase (AMP-forming)/AMP-acid ligase II/thioesterase domain-containing protein
LIHTATKYPKAGVRYLPGADTEGSFQSYPSLLDESLRILGGLRLRGLRPRDKVGLLLETPQEFIPALWACVLGGYVPCPLVPLRADTNRWVAQLEHLHRLLENPLIITTKGLLGDLPQVAGLSLSCLDELATSVPETAVHDADRDDLALLMLTSGSTGHAKAVQLTHGMLLAAMSAKSARLDVKCSDITLNWISFDHIAAIELHLLPLSVGAIQSQVESSAILGDPLYFIRAIDEHRVTLTFTPNFLLGHINRTLDPQSTDFRPDLSSLRRILSGGEAIVCATAQRFLDRLARFGLARDALAPAFGMTETCAGSVYSTEFPDIDTGAEFASLGTPVPGLQMRIVDDHNEPLPDGEAGDLQLRGPMVFRGYFNNDEATAAAFTADGWFRTGDCGMVTDGRLRLVGRRKDSIIVNGVNYFSHDLETVLAQLDGVQNSTVAAFPTRPAGADTEQLVVVFTPEIGRADEVALHRLLVAVRSSVVLHWGFRPALILPLPESEITKTSLGKIQRSQLRQRLEAGDFTELQQLVAGITTRQLGGYSAPEGDTENALVEIYAEMFDLDVATISATASFFDLGGTSLDILRLKQLVEYRLGVTDLPVLSILRAPTARDLARRLTTGEATAEGYDPLVPLQVTGDKTPLFCVHPGVGEVLVFVNLAKYFVGERPFYALRARGFNEGETYFGSMDEMVENYVRAIRAQQSTGPYAIAGYSYGGVVAFEIAKALEAQGERVDFVGIFNLPPHIKARMMELDPIEGAVNLAFFLSLINKVQAKELPEKLRSMSQNQQEALEYLIEISPKQRLAELSLDLPKFTAWTELAQSLLTIGREYEPAGTVASVTVFYAIPLRGTKEDWLNEQLTKWDMFTREPNRYIDVPGEHYTLMGPQHVAAFQAILRKELDRALGGN